MPYLTVTIESLEECLPFLLASIVLKASLASSGSSSPRQWIIIVKNSSKSISPDPRIRAFQSEIHLEVVFYRAKIYKC